MNSTKQIITSLYSNYRNLILYAVIGSFSAGMDFLVFTVLTSAFGVFYILANIVSVSVGIFTSFFLNRKYNFRVKDKVFKRFVFFIAIGLTGLCLSSALLYFFIDFMGIAKIQSKLFSIVLVVLMQYFLNKYITFKKTEL
jgi:putative flippase GtrA